MASTEALAHWTEVEGHLRAALSELSTRLMADDVKRASHYLDHNELGLAIEQVLIAASDDGVVIDDGVGERIDRAATLMGMDPGLWKLTPNRLRDALESKGTSK